MSNFINKCSYAETTSEAESARLSAAPGVPNACIAGRSAIDQVGYLPEICKTRRTLLVLVTSVRHHPELALYRRPLASDDLMLGKSRDLYESANSETELL